MRPLMAIQPVITAMRLIMGLVSTIGRTVITATGLITITGVVMVGVVATIAGAAITAAGTAGAVIGVDMAVGEVGDSVTV